MADASPQLESDRLRRDAVGWLLTVTAAVGLLGLGLQGVLGYGPWLTLFWNEPLMSPLVTAWTDMSWQEYVSSASVTAKLEWVGFGVGVFYAAAGLMAIVGRPRWLAAGALVLAAGLVGVEAWLSALDKGGRVFQGLEYALQFVAPLLVVGWALLGWRGAGTAGPLRLAVSLTFFSHGLWALGASVDWGPVQLDYPTPGQWIDMVLSVFAFMDESMARRFLIAAGVLDMVVAVGVLLPGRMARLVLVWAFIWGTATAAARIVAHLDAIDWAESMGYWSAQALRRAPHAGLPLALWLILRLRARRGPQRPGQRNPPGGSVAGSSASLHSGSAKPAGASTSIRSSLSRSFDGTNSSQCCLAHTPVPSPPGTPAAVPDRSAAAAPPPPSG